MRNLLCSIAACCAATPLAAQLTTTYTGFQREGGKDTPASAQFSVESGRVAMILKGSRSVRMLYDAKAQVLRMVSDDDKQYFDITKTANGQNPMMAAMQKQLESMPKEQRAMAEQMMKSAMGAKANAPQLVYVWSKEKQTIAGYECTRVDGMKGEDKVTEYCGTTSSDFKLSDPEHQTVLDMQSYLRNFMIMVRSPDDGTRAFQWDTATDGYPVLTRCYRDGKLTLELTLATVSHKPPGDDLFAIPGEYKRMDFSRGR